MTQSGTLFFFDYRLWGGGKGFHHLLFGGENFNRSRQICWFLARGKRKGKAYVFNIPTHEPFGELGGEDLQEGVRLQPYFFQ